ncbi:MAG: hypothetical protein JJ971_07655 [Balneolaceae bacterium]|nr:hypothetical protein [Balneolaceae bacterium]MBO6546890.1 hypothetical protein [Balneolaceae bacterium]MBO6649250.1 hypothetical protein [Balneolaceae bacterium]
MIRILHLLLLLLAFESSLCFGQLSFQISNYEKPVDGAGNQNWDISSDGDQRIFIANNYGLLVLKNTNAQLFGTQRQTIFRSVAFLDNRIYTGSFEDFGYWAPDNNEGLKYTSLAARLDNPDMNNDAIWKIVKHEGNIYFHSFGSIYGFDGENVFRLSTSGTYMFLYKIEDKVYTQRVGNGLFTLEGNEFIPIEGSGFLENEEIRSLIKLRDGNLMIASTDGLYRFDGNNFSELNFEGSEELIQNEVNVITQTPDKIIIGTILNGLYIFDQDFNLLENITTDDQLENDTILSLEADDFGNIWVGMDRGLAYIAFDTPLQNYTGSNNDIGSVYAASLFENELYIGTNQGIYWYKKDSNGNFFDRKLIPGSQGQVWFLEKFDGKLYGGLNDGTYLISDKSLSKVSDISGGYTLKSYPQNNQDVLLQSTYSDLVVYKKVQNRWQQSHTLSGFRTPARFMEFDHLGNIWLGHTVKGIYQLQPDISLTTINNIWEPGSEAGLVESTNRVFKFDGRIFTSFSDSLYEWDHVNKTFITYSGLDPFFTTSGTIKNILPAGNHRYWVIKDSEINLFEIHFNSVKLLYTLIPGMYGLEMVEGYESIIQIDDDIHLISLDDGFVVLDLDKINRSKYPRSDVEIESLIASNANGNQLEIRSELSSKEYALSNSYSNISLSWSSTQTVGNQAFFQYKLNGLNTDWSDWSPENSTRFERLLPGSYTFQVRSIGANGVITDTTNVFFTIGLPWYLTKGAYLFYLLIALSLAFMIRLYISRKQWRKLGKELEEKHKKAQRDREKAEKEIIKLTNEKLQNEIEHKSAQLASNTMAMMRKNNLLTSLKEELDRQKKELGKKMPSSYYNKINKLIEQGIEDEHEWEVFEQLYDQAHGDFFKRLKEKHPQLTPSDLRLCAYLRMNLSSKEIAPLLNISVRGVEERRYRLRKRLDISTDVNLTELIMTF